MRLDLVDDALVNRLPLPLAQLYRRAHNAKSAQERHHAAYYLWEAALKLLGSSAVVAFLDSGRTPDARLAEALQALARPAVGHWWAIVRALTVELTDADADFARLKEMLLGRARSDLPRVAGLDAALVAALEGTAGSRGSVRLTELFDRLVRYRNQEFGHGAVGQRPARHYEEMSRALLAGVPQLLERLDVLAGRRLVYLADVRRLGSGAWLVERFELAGESPRRLESLERTHEEAATLLPQQVYLAGTALLPLHPLVAYDFEANEFLFLNARRGKQRVEYLSYTTGRHTDRVEAAAQNALLARLLDVPVDDGRREQWQAKSQAEEGPAVAEAPLRRLGEFELLSELGRGGMGVVYRAWQPSLGRQVALKSLLRVGDAKAEKRFAREIGALGQVEHPHLVRIFTSGLEGDRWFYAMELVEGTTLGAVCEHLQAAGSAASAVDLPTWQQAVSTACEAARRAEKPLSDDKPGEGEIAPPAAVPSVPSGSGPQTPTGRSYVRHVAELVRQVAEAAHALHEKGVIHRDIKPDNVMVAPDGASATLMDLGLAQVADEAEGRLTRTRQFVGTLRYASPEQVLAVARLERRSDVYSLGATLWELLALRPLFGATDAMPTPELMQKIQIEEPARLRRLNPAVPRDLAAVVENCLQKDAKKRYATAQELAEELAAFLAGNPVKARAVTGPERLWKWARRRPAQAALVAMIFLTLVGMVVGGGVFAWQAEEGRRAQVRLRKVADQKRVEADRHRQEVENQKGIVEKKAEELRTTLAHSSVQLANREYEAGNVVHARELLADVPRDLRRWEWGYLRRTIRGSYCTLYGHTGSVSSVAFSPDGRRLASGARAHFMPCEVKVWEAATGREVLTLKGHTNWVSSVAFSPDGKTLWSRHASGRVIGWNVQTGKQLDNPGPPPQLTVMRGARHPSAPLLALPERDTILLIDVSPPDADELAFREAMARFDPFWHEEQAAEAEKKHDWFAAAFHRRLLAENAPWKPDAWRKLLAACDKLGDDRPALAVCNRLLQRDPTLAPIYLHRSLLQGRTLNFWGAWADQLATTYFSAIDHPDWADFALPEIQQGHLAATKGDWPRAVRHFTRASVWQRHNPDPSSSLAWARLASGDEDGYRGTCRRLHARFGNLEGNRTVFTLAVLLGQGLQPLTPGPLVIEQAVQQDAGRRAYVLARTALLAPDNGIAPGVLVTVAARANRVFRSHSLTLETHGAALYRAGQWTEAVKQLEEARRRHGKDGSNWQNFFLAMAYHRLGDAAQSRAAFDRAKLARNANWMDRGSGTTDRLGRGGPVARRQGN